MRSTGAVFSSADGGYDEVWGLEDGGGSDFRVEDDGHDSLPKRDIFYQWFVTEQVEEEANAEDVIRKLKLVNDTPGGLFMIDKELALRVFVPPATTAGA